MLTIWKLVLVAGLVLTLTPACSAQFNTPLETRNAALRYWLAFGEMHDLPADSSTSALLDQLVTGGMAWDEAKLGNVLDANASAIIRMQQATKLPECDWGLDYSNGVAASIAFVPKARVMAALNTLYGMRQAAKGDEDGAVDTWLAGVRFAQDVAKGGSLIFALTARPGLVDDLRAMTRAADSGKLSPADRKRVTQVIQALPESGFDWGQAFFLDGQAVEIFTQQLRAAKDPSKVFLEIMGSPMPAGFVLPTHAASEKFHAFLLAASQTYRLAPQQAKIKFEDLEKQRTSLDPYYQHMIPTFGMNNQRIQVAAAREQLLKSL
jgi:hypothetical protein